MEQATKEVELKFLAELQGDNPTIMGMDYFMVIYVASGVLALSMFSLYVISEDDTIKNMVMVHGTLSIGLMMAVAYYRNRLHNQQVERKTKKMKEEVQKAKEDMRRK